MRVLFSFPIPYQLGLTELAQQRSKAPRGSVPALEVAPRSTSIHLSSRQYGQSLGTLIQGVVDQKFLEHAWQMGFLAELCKSN